MQVSRKCGNWRAKDHVMWMLTNQKVWQLEGKGSCDVDVDQSAGGMVM